MSKDFTKQFNTIEKINGSWVWDVKCAQCEKLLTTALKRLELSKNRYHVNKFQEPPIHFFCSKECKQEWMSKGSQYVEIEDPSNNDCPYCDKGYLTQRGLNIHIAKVHPHKDKVKSVQDKTRKYECPHCDFYSLDKRGLKVHVGHKHKKNEVDEVDLEHDPNVPEPNGIFNFLKSAPIKYIRALDGQKLINLILEERGAVN